MGGKIQGFITYYINAESEVFYIPLIAVLPEYQHSGIGKQMMDSLKEKLDGEKINKIQLEVYKDNEKAYNFYTSNGFEIMEDRREKYLMVYQYKA